MPGLLERLRREFGTRLDAMIRKIENHEALVESAVRGLEASLARAEREHARATAASERLRARVGDERDAAQSWQERAIREPLEARGIECLRRSKRASRRADELAERLTENGTFLAQLAARTALLRERLGDVEARVGELRARQSDEESLESEANGATSAADLVVLLQRWEAHLRDTELATGAPAIRFETEDDTPEEAELVRELRELKEKMR